MSAALSIAEMASEMEDWGTPTAAERGKIARERGHDERARLAVRLRDEGAHDLASKLDDCGSKLRLMCTSCSAVKTVEIACKRRWCPACAWLVQRERLGKYKRATETIRWPLFVTLTQPNSEDPECIRELRAHWGKMRRRKLMVDRVAGGISTIEVTNTGNGWHPHLHVLCDCEWLALHTPKPAWRDSEAVKRQKYDHARLELSALWAQIIGNPTAIVSALRKEPTAALTYALKYAVKGSDLLACDDEIAPLIRVLSKSRMLSTFGSLRGLNLDDPEEERPACVCPDCQNETSYVLESMVDRLYERSYNASHCIR